MEKTILITGGYGFIGGNFIRLLFKERPEYNIVNIDSETYAANHRNILDLKRSEVEIVSYRNDISDPEVVDSIFQIHKPHIVVNFAAETHVDNSIKNPSIFVKTNVLGTNVLLSSALKHNVEKYIQISTDEVYGHLAPYDPPFDEETPINPRSPYSASKAGGDHLVQSYHNTYGLNTCITRCSNNYGPYQNKEKLIPLMIYNALNNKKLPVYGNGLNIRDWIHVDDHCRAILTVLENGKSGEVYNVGGSNEMTNIEMVKLILKLLNKSESLIEYVEDRKGHDFRYAINSSKIRNELGWTPLENFEKNIRKTISWYIENIKKDDIVKCSSCGWLGETDCLLIGENPFFNKFSVYGCPRCFEIENFE